MSQFPSTLHRDVREKVVYTMFEVERAVRALEATFGPANYVTGAFFSEDPLTPFAQMTCGSLTPNDAALFATYMVDKGRRVMVSGPAISATTADPSRGLYPGAISVTLPSWRGKCLGVSTSGLKGEQDAAISAVTLWRAGVILQESDLYRDWSGQAAADPYIRALVAELKAR